VDRLELRRDHDGGGILRSHALGLLLLLATAPFGWVACNVLFGIDEPTLAPPKAETGPIGDDSGCGSARWPGAPASDDGGEDRTFVVALKEVSIEVAGDRPLGFDLDGICTCPGPGACVPKKPLAAGDAGDAAVHCDEKPGGRDISLNREVLGLVTKAEGFSAKLLNEKLAQGRYGIVAEVRGYNGGQNDRAVEVAVFMSSGVAGDAGASWDGGGDRWDIDPSSLTSGDAATMVPAYVDKTAYVRDGILVASKFIGVRLALGAGAESLVLELGQSVVTAKIVPRGTTYGLEEGTIAGRWTTANILRAIAPLNAPFIPGNPVMCTPAGKFAYDYVKEGICNAADLSQSAARDEDRLADCDAVSFGMRFTAEPASVGGVRARLVPDAGCPPWTDDCTK